MAEWLTNAANPLTPRVIANRVWQHLFGEGIVKTVDNFGFNGDRPSHPELLDYLASEFTADGWSMKRLVRKVVLSRAYGLSAEAVSSHMQVDPANRLVWRHSPRRLEAEEIRDAMLFTAGTLLLQPPAASPSGRLRMVEMQDNGPESRSIHDQANQSTVRSVYLPLVRGLTPNALQAFDPATQTLVTGRRDATTVPAQALFLLNSSFVRKQALGLAESLLAQSKLTPPVRIAQAYRVTVGRNPSAVETRRVLQFLAQFESQYAASAPRTQGPVVPSAAAKVAESPGFTLPADPDNVDRTEYIALEESVEPPTAKAAAWAAFVQALYASAEFRFIR